MQAGRLRHTVIIQENTDTQSGRGEVTDSWDTALTVRAAVDPLTARELLAADQQLGEISHKIVIRYNATVTEAHRVLWGTRIFDIQGVIRPGEHRNYLELMCVETK